MSDSTPTQDQLKSMKLTKNQYDILSKMDTEYSYSFSWFEELGLTKKQLSAEFKVLRELGLVRFDRGLFDDDGMTAGSGYGLVYGSQSRDRYYELLKEYEASLSENSSTPTQDQLREWKKEIGEIPENTCPDIDKAIKEIDTFCKQVEYVSKNKSRYDSVDDLVSELPDTWWEHPAVSILEDLRKDNLQLRELGRFWYEKCVELSQLPTPPDHA